MGKHKHKSKKHKEKKSKHKHKKKHYSSSSDSSTTEDEWVEKETGNDKRESKIEDEHKQERSNVERDEWMNLTSLGGLFSHKDQRKVNEENKRKEKEADKYNPKTNVRELNPYWRDGGEGLPSVSKSLKFKKPGDSDRSWDQNSSRGRSSNWRKKDEDSTSSNWRKKDEDSTSSNWRKKDEESNIRIKEQPTSSRTSDIIYEAEEEYKETTSRVEKKTEESTVLTDKEMNDIAAKIVKAEILGNMDRVAELKEKLENARQARSSTKSEEPDEEVLLTKTDSKGFSKPVMELKSDPYNTKRKKQTINTHDVGKRQKYYPDDGKHSLQNMFENEKFGSSDKQEEEFMKAASKLSKADDLDDMFMDNIRRKESSEKQNRKDRDRAIHEHQKMTQSLDNCSHCIQSTAMLKHLMISLGETSFLSLPQYEPITERHCFILPVRHVTCSTQLDENEWAEILQFRKSLTNMFKAENKTIIFYETAINLHSYPHMVIHCVPVPEEEGDMAPIYFKKAIDECEMEWSTNKKLINMAGKDVRRCVPKGLPYFWVSFGMQEGFAHVIEEQKYFPKYFAEEIIGGILDLHHSKWRKASAQKFDVQKLRVMEFSKNWTKYDCTVTN